MTIKFFPEEVVVDADALHESDRVIVRRMHVVDNPYILTAVANISEKQKVITTVDGLHFSRDGWRYEEVHKYNHRLLQATPEILDFIRRNSLIGYLIGIDWSAQPTKTLEVVVAAYKSSMGLLE